MTRYTGIESFRWGTQTRPGWRCTEKKQTLDYPCVWQSITRKSETVHWHVERKGCYHRHTPTGFLFITFKDTNVFPQLSLTLTALLILASPFYPVHHPLLLEKGLTSAWGWLATLRLWTLQKSLPLSLSFRKGLQSFISHLLPSILPYHENPSLDSFCNGDFFQAASASSIPLSISPITKRSRTLQLLLQLF